MISLAVRTTYVMHGRVKMSKVIVRKNLNRWFKEKWVDVSRKDPKTGKHPPCGRSKAKKDSKGYPKCRPSVKVSSKTPKTSGSMSEGEKRAATKRKRSKKQGVGGKPTIVKSAEGLKQYYEYLSALNRKPSELDSQYQTNRGFGLLHHVTSNDTHHYFVDSRVDGIRSWLGLRAMNHQVWKVPHEDYEHYQEHGEFPKYGQVYNTGYAPENIKEGIDMAHVERDIDADPTSFGYEDVEKAYKRSRHSRRKAPKDIFSVKVKDKKPKSPELHWGDPEGDKGHLDLRLNTRFRPEEKEKAIELGNSAWKKHGEKIWNNPKMRKKLMSGGELALITHTHDPPIMSSSDLEPSATQVISHNLLRIGGRFHPDTGEPVPAVTTAHGASNMNAIKNKYDYIIDASDPEMPFDKGYGGFFENGEPMDIAMRLLKMPLIPYSLKEREGGYTGQFQDPITDEIMPLHLDGDIDEEYGISANIPERANTEVTGSSLFGSARATGDSATEPDYQRRGYMTALYDALAAMLDKKHSSTLYPNSVQSEEGRKFWGDKESWPVKDDILETGEPMEIAFQLLKQAKSPEALANKRKYDTKYHSTPDRVKYRQELNQERRKRGVYGKGGKDMSHTKNGNLVAEDASKNRARHFKSRGTLKSVKILRSS